MTANELRKKFIDFFEKKGHKVIPSASLVPENDPTALFISAGMQPFVPYLLGEKHPMGKKLVDVQKCIRTDDIDEVGDKVHHTFFEMLGNWSLGDYFKKEAIEYSFEFLTSKDWLNIDKDRLAVSVFAGDSDSSFDQEAYNKWISLGISTDRIAKLPKKNNWWGPGESGPCGPDTEMFYWTGKEPAPDKFDDKDANWVEVWNDVFMQYYLKNGEYTPLAQKNVDTGMGLERMLAVLNGFDDNYKTELFSPIIEKIEEISSKEYFSSCHPERSEGSSEASYEKEFRIIADHLKAAVFAINDGVLPSNKGAGYVVRRLIRRAIVKGQQLGIKDNFTSSLADVVFEIYKETYFDGATPDVSSVIPSEVEGSFNNKISPTVRQSSRGRNDIKQELEKEEDKFRNTLEKGMLEFHKMTGAYPVVYPTVIGGKTINGRDLFDLYQNLGFPLELSLEIAKEKNIKISNEAIEQYNSMLEEHKQLSRTASAGMFKGGLADDGEIAVKYHTSTHLLHQALRQVLGEHVQQKGSNINSERLRFDFTHTDKMTPEQISEVENIVNEQIKKDLPVTMEEMSPEEAKKQGALGFFEHKYGEKVKVYTIGPSDNYFSREICGGPHVENIGTLGHFKIKKEESSSAGIRRIKAVLLND